MNGQMKQFEEFKRESDRNDRLSLSMFVIGTITVVVAVVLCVCGVFD